MSYGSMPGGKPEQPKIDANVPIAASDHKQETHVNAVGLGVSGNLVGQHAGQTSSHENHGQANQPAQGQQASAAVKRELKDVLGDFKRVQHDIEKLGKDLNDLNEVAVGAGAVAGANSTAHNKTDVHTGSVTCAPEIHVHPLGQVTARDIQKAAEPQLAMAT